MTGTTMLCRFCGRPIIGSPMKLGNAGEPYHAECTMPPFSDADECRRKLRVLQFLESKGETHMPIAAVRVLLLGGGTPFQNELDAIDASLGQK